MSHGKEVIIDIDAQGGSSIDLQNFHGKGCAEVLAEFAGPDEAINIQQKREYQECEPQVQERLRG